MTSRLSSARAIHPASYHLVGVLDGGLGSTRRQVSGRIPAFSKVSSAGECLLAISSPASLSGTDHLLGLGWTGAILCGAVSAIWEPLSALHKFHEALLKKSLSPFLVHHVPEQYGN
jgi:hypothetical protein